MNAFRLIRRTCIGRGTQSGGDKSVRLRLALKVQQLWELVPVLLKFTVLMEQAHHIAQLALLRKVVSSKLHGIAHNLSCLLGMLH